MAKANILDIGSQLSQGLTVYYVPYSKANSRIVLVSFYHASSSDSSARYCSHEPSYKYPRLKSQKRTTGNKIRLRGLVKAPNRTNVLSYINHKLKPQLQFSVSSNDFSSSSSSPSSSSIVPSKSRTSYFIPSP